MTLITDSFLVDLVGLVTAIVAVVYAYFLWTFQYWKRRNIPYLEPVIPWGNLENPTKRTMFIGDRFRYIYKEARLKGRDWKYCGMFGMTKPLLFILDLDLLRQIMVKDFNNFVDRGFYSNEKDDPLSCHLFALDGIKWKNLRAKLSPTFTSGKMKIMFPKIMQCASIMAEYLEQQANQKEAVDFKSVAGNFSTDVIGSCAFGLDCNSFKDPDSVFRRNGTRVFERTKAGSLKLSFCLYFPRLAVFMGLRIIPKDVADFFMKVVDDTVLYREKNNLSRNDFLQLLIDIKNNKETETDGHKGDGKTLTMEELAAQCLVFFLAGFETSSTTLTFALYELATHQDIQDKVREEVEEVLAKHQGQLTYDSLTDLKYMKQVIDETLRKYSPGTFMTRVSSEDYKVPGAVIEKGTTIVIPIHGIHHDEEYYENPSVFDPERFTEENKAARHPYAHIPFGEGPRICIGERFGLLEVKIGLTTILRKFRLTLNQKTKEPLEFSKVAIVPMVEGGMWLNIENLQ
nr:cytochrome P450 [Pharsalia antennata]